MDWQDVSERLAASIFKIGRTVSRQTLQMLPGYNSVNPENGGSMSL